MVLRVVGIPQGVPQGGGYTTGCTMVGIVHSCICWVYHGGYSTPLYMPGYASLGIPHPVHHRTGYAADLRPCSVLTPWALSGNIPWVRALVRVKVRKGVMEEEASAHRTTPLS